jgi:hypothetical protein
MIELLFYVLGLMILGVVIFYGAIPLAGVLAKMGLFFYAVKKGVAVLERRNGMNVRYRGNFEDEGKFTNPETGKILDIFEKDPVTGDMTNEYNPKNKALYETVSAELKSNWIYNWLGVFWMGTGSLYSYNFSEGIVAKSIQLKNVRKISFSNSESKKGEMSLISGDGTFDLELDHAGTALNYLNGAWLQTIEAACQSAFRDFVSTRKYFQVTTQQMEGKSELREYFLSLNTSIKGNPGLVTQVGIRITKVSISNISVDKEWEEKFKAPGLAKINAIVVETAAAAAATALRTKADAEFYETEKKADADKYKVERTAEANFVKAQKEAAGNKEIGNTENDILKTRKDILGEEGTVGYEEAKSLGKLSSLPGMLSYKSGGQTSVLVNKTEPKPKKEE